MNSGVSFVTRLIFGFVMQSTIYHKYLNNSFHVAYSTSIFFAVFLHIFHISDLNRSTLIRR